MIIKYIPATITPEGKKVPLISNWYNEASSDMTKIEGWKNTFGNQIKLWGCVTGSKTGIVVVDLDFKDCDAFESIKNAGLNLPKTMWQQTLNGGYHFIYKLPQGKILKNTVKKYAPGVDTRAEGGWIGLYGLSNDEIAEAPEWLLSPPKEEHAEIVGFNFTLSHSVAEEKLEEICYEIANASAGEANNILNIKSYEAANFLIASGAMTKDFVFARLMEAAKERGKDKREASATINSGIEAGLLAPAPFVVPFAPIAAKLVGGVLSTERWTPFKPTLEMLFNKSKLKRPQLFKDWSAEDITILTADGGTGKSTLTLFESVCLALGRSFMGFQNSQVGKTLYITGEDDAEKLYAILGAICQQMELSEEELEIILDSIYIKADLDLTIVTKDKNGFYFPSPTALEKLKESIGIIQPKRIIFDPIASFWGSEQGLNDMSKAVTKFMGYLRKLGNCEVLAINHMGKSSSQAKDMSQFAGRGGSALPSHSRISRVMRKIDCNEFLEYTGQVLEERQSAILLQINKFSDGSPYDGKLFVLRRNGYLFDRLETRKLLNESEMDKRPDVEIILERIREHRTNNIYPTKSMLCSELNGILSRQRVSDGLNLLQFRGYDQLKLRVIDNPDATIREKCYVIIDSNGKEI